MGWVLAALGKARPRLVPVVAAVVVEVVVAAVVVVTATGAVKYKLSSSTDHQEPELPVEVTWTYSAFWEGKLTTSGAAVPLQLATVSQELPLAETCTSLARAYSLG